MPTQKAVKATRKLKRKASKVNNRRRNVGKQPLSFKHFYKQSHKRNRRELEARSEARSKLEAESPFKKRKLNEQDKEQAEDNKQEKPKREAPFGFGKNMQPTHAEYQRFLADINDSESDADSDGEHKSPLNQEPVMSASALSEENAKLQQEIKQHQDALKSLKEADPEFYKHLQETDGNLLAFGEEDQYDLGDLGDIDDVVDDMQNDQLQRTKQELQGIEDEEQSDDDGYDDDAVEMNKHRNSNTRNETDSFMDEEDDDDDDVQFSDGGSDDYSDKQDVADGDDAIDHIVNEAMMHFDVTELEGLIQEFEENKSVEAMDKLLQAFASFVELIMEDNRKDKKMTKASITVANNPAFQKLLHYALTKMAPKIVDALKISPKEQTQPNYLKQSQKFMTHRRSFLRYFKYLYAFFKDIGDAAMQRLFLMHCKQLVFLLLCMKEPMQRLFIKHATKQWCSGTVNTRIDAFMLLYEIGKRMHADNTAIQQGKQDTGNKHLLQLFKYMYQSYVTVCKRVSRATMPGINFMINCMVEMYKLNPVTTYKDAFKRLRSIAFHVKQSLHLMQKPQTKHLATKQAQAKKLKQAKQETVQSIYNWRFINVLRLWAKVLGSHSDRNNSDVHLLYYPFIQICCSVLTIARSKAYDPGRMHVIQSLLDLVEVCQQSDIRDRRIYVPLAPHLIAMMNNPAFAKKRKEEKQNEQQKKGGKNNQKNKNKNKKQDQNEGDEMEEKQSRFTLRFKIKIADSDFDTKHLHHWLLNNTVRLLTLYFSYYSYSISFPEVSFPAQVFMKQFLSNPNISAELKSTVRMLSNKLKENANWITNKRQNVQFSPQDFEKVDAFLATERINQQSPLSKFVKSVQFENLSEVTENEESEQRDNSKKNKEMPLIAEEEKKKKRMEKKEKRKKLKQQQKQSQQQRQKERKQKFSGKANNSNKSKRANNLQDTYEKAKQSKNGILTASGDIVEDLCLSDDDM